MIELPVASELVNLANFLVLDIVMLSIVMYVSGKLAGFANHAVLNRRQHVKLVNFDVPLIGGGLIMPKGWRRSTFILLRISVVVAVAACNFGLEGRSRVAYSTKMVRVRVPGEPRSLKEAATRIHSNTELWMRCADGVQEGLLKFGSVLDGRCYAEVEEGVVVKKAKVEFEMVRGLSLTGCVGRTRCNSASTAYVCGEGEVVCQGIRDAEECVDRIDSVHPLSCQGVVYSDEGLWMCDMGQIQPESRNVTGRCRWILARREDVKSWTEYLLFATTDHFRAIFAAAYAIEKRQVARIPGGDQSVTVVSLWWIIPAIWVVGVAAVLGGWWIMHMVRGSDTLAHDERGLTRLLDRQIEVKIANDESDATLTSISF